MFESQEKIVKGNFEEEKHKYRGWGVGHFVADASPLRTSDLEIKWCRHAKGERKEGIGANCTAKTLFILISGKFKLIFPELEQEFTLDKEGDYVFFDATVAHRWEVLSDTLGITVRWPSLPGDQVVK